jgi:hypothetical protein
MQPIVANSAEPARTARHRHLSGWLRSCNFRTLGGATHVAEVLVEYPDFVRGEDGNPYVARACGAPNGSGMWQGWIEFVRLDAGHAVRSARETTQPNRQDTVYWATGLTPVYLEGALHRALKPLVRPRAGVTPQPYFDEPAPDAMVAPPAGEAVLNPFSVYRKGESVLRAQLNAMSPWHLVNIIRAHRLSDQDPLDLNLTSTAELVELIVASVRIHEETGASIQE